MTLAAEAGVDWIQIREKDLAADAFSELVCEVLRCVPAACRILVNDRLDLAFATGAGGVHLGEKSISVEDACRFAREREIAKGFLIGASVHSLEAGLAAQKDGADYVIFGPVFATPSKAVFGEPQGLSRLQKVCSALTIPVLAIGGITVETAKECYANGAAGVAGIRIFQEARDMSAIVRQLRG